MITAVAKKQFASFAKVRVSKPVVDIDGDEMTKVIWGWIKERVSLPTITKSFSTSTHTWTSRLIIMTYQSKIVMPLRIKLQ